MARKRSNPNQLIVVPMPLRGLDVDVSYEDLRPNTTRSVLNCRPQDPTSDLRRLSRRAGSSKHIATRVAASPVQNISTIIVPRNLETGTLDCITPYDDTSHFRQLKGTDGTSVTGDASTAMAGANGCACYDNENNAYVVSYTSTTVQISKRDTAHAVAWTKTITHSATVTIVGVQADDDVVYIYATGSTVGTAAVYRINTSDGNTFGASPWLSGTALLWQPSTNSSCYKPIALANGALTVLGKSATANLLVVQIYSVATGLLTNTVSAFTLSDAQASWSMRYGVIGDYGGNFYAFKSEIWGAGADAYDMTIKKLSPSGTVLATGDFGVASGAAAQALLLDICYEPTTFAVGMVGFKLFNTTNSFDIISADTLALSSGSQPSARTQWDAIAAAGDATYRLRRSGGATDVIKLTPATSMTVATWTVSSSASTGGWIASTAVPPVATNDMRSARSLRALQLTNGTLSRFDSGVLETISATFCSSVATIVNSTRYGAKIIYADGLGYPYYNGGTNTTGDLYTDVVTAAMGDTTKYMPHDSNGRKCRLICTWRGRLVLAGLLSDIGKWFMSAVLNEADWDYSPATPSAAQAISSVEATAAQIGDGITALIPCGDNILIFGCSSSIWRLTGDPADGGTSTLVSDITGIAYGNAWCKDTQGNVYFMGSRGRVFKMDPAGQPSPISSAIDTHELSGIDFDSVQVSMAWNERKKGIDIWITPYDGTTARKYWWDAYTPVDLTIRVVQKPGSWWKDSIPNAHAPLAVCVLDGDAAADRKVIFGSYDGYIREEDNEADSDDGVKIESYCLIGPLADKNGGSITLKDLPTILGEESSDLNFAIQSAASRERAFLAKDRYTGTFTSGRNRSYAVRSSDFAHFIRVYSEKKAVPWSIESMRVSMKVELGGNKIFHVAELA